MSKAQTAKKPAKAKPLTLAEKIVAQLRALQAGKEAYGRANVLLEECIEEWKKERGYIGGTFTLPDGTTAQLVDKFAAVTLPDGTTAQLVDKFAEKNRVGSGMGVNRYEIEVSRSADVTAKL